MVALIVVGCDDADESGGVAILPAQDPPPTGCRHGHEVTPPIPFTPKLTGIKLGRLGVSDDEEEEALDRRYCALPSSPNHQSVSSCFRRPRNDRVLEGKPDADDDMPMFLSGAFSHKGGVEPAWGMLAECGRARKDCTRAWGADMATPESAVQSPEA
ncbi:hypothetical protein FRC09_007634 [Ceratobasidium sp. 395]|nr:hypothetical protein FRC09_007634 [Ceratobasidium sp. 395]